MDTTSDTNNAKIPIPFPSTNSPSSYPSSSQSPRRRPSLASPSPPTPLFPSTSSSAPLKIQRGPPAPLILSASSSSPQHNESGGSSTGITPYHYSSKSRPSTAGSRTSGRSQSVSVPLMANSQTLGVGVSLSGTGTAAVPPDSPGARAMMKRLLANPSPAAGSPSERGGYASPAEREREKGHASPYGATSGSESDGFGLYSSAAGWTRRGTGTVPSPRLGDSSGQGWKYGSGSESGHRQGYQSYGSRTKHKGWRSTSGEDTNGETELPYYTRSGSASGSQSESPYPKPFGTSSRHSQPRVVRPASSPGEGQIPTEIVKEKEKKQRNVLRRRASGRSANAAEDAPPSANAARNGYETLAPTLPLPIPVSPITLSVPIPTIGSISAPQSPTFPHSPSTSLFPSSSLQKSSKNLHRSASASALKSNNIPGSPRHRSSVVGHTTSTTGTGQTISHGATLRPPLPYGQNQHLHAQGGHVGESVSFQSARSQSSKGSSNARSPVVSTLVPVSRTGSGSASGHGSARGSGGGGKSPIRERHERDVRESLKDRVPEKAHMTPAEALVAAYKKQEQEQVQKAKDAELKKHQEAEKAQSRSLKAATWAPSQHQGQDARSYEDHSSSSSHQDHYMAAANADMSAPASSGDGSPTPYYTVFGSTSGRVVAVGSPQDSSWDTTYKHGYWDSSVLGNRNVTVSVGERSENKPKGLRTLTRKVSERWKKQLVVGGTVVVGRMDDNFTHGPGSTSGSARMSADSTRVQAQIQSKNGKSVLPGAARASMQEKRPSGLITHSTGAPTPRSPLPRSTHVAAENVSPKSTTLRRKRSTLAAHQEHEMQVNRRSLRLSIDKFPDSGGPHLPLLPIRADQPPPKSPRKDHAHGGYPAPRSFSQPTAQPQPQSQKRACLRTAPGTPTIPTPGSASPSMSSVSIGMSQGQSRAPSSPSVTSSNGATGASVMSPLNSGSSSSTGGKFWKLMRRLSVGGLKERYYDGAEDAPPVPPLPTTFVPSSPATPPPKDDRGRTEVDFDNLKIPHSQPKRSKSLEAESMQRGRNPPSEKPPMPNLPRSSMTSLPRSSTTKLPSTGAPSSSSTTLSRASTTGRPSTATRSSSPVSSDVGSSKRFFYKAQSGGSSSSSFIDDGIAKPPLPIPVGVSPLAKHIIPPPELGKVHDRENQRNRSRDKSRETERKSSDRDRQEDHRQRQEHQHVPLPVPPRTRLIQPQTLPETSKDVRSPSPDIPAFSTSGVINTFKPRTTPTTSPISSSPTISLTKNLPPTPSGRKTPPALTLNSALSPPPRPTRSAARPGPHPTPGPSISAVGGLNRMPSTSSPYQEVFTPSSQHSVSSGLRRGISASAAVPPTTRHEPSSTSKPLPRIEQESIPAGRKSESHVWDHGGHAYDTFGHSHARLTTPTASNFGPNTFTKLHHRRSSGGLSTTSTARPDGMLKVKRRTNSFGASSLSTTSLISNATVEPSDLDDDVAVLQFRELNNEPGLKKALTEKEKADKWADLLERSAKAGGTLHFAGGNRDW